MIHRWMSWRFVVPRLLLAVVAVTALWIAIEPVLHRFLVSFGERIIEAKVDIDELNISLANCDLVLHGVQVANPHAPHRNLLECERATFDIEPYSLLERRVVVRQARLSGVRLDMPPHPAGGNTGPLPDEFHTPLADLGRSCFRHFFRIVEQDLQNDLLSLRLSEDLAARWPAECQRLQTRADELRRQSQALRGDIDSLSDPRTSGLSFPAKVQEVDRLRQEMASLQAEVDRLSAQVERDRHAIDIARRHDEDVIRRKLTLKELDPQRLSEYLLSDDLRQHAEELVGWIKLARQYWPTDVQLPPGERSHGEDIAFPGLPPQAKGLVQQLWLDGTLHRGGHTTAWRGEIRSLTTDPAVLGQPMVIRAETLGAQPLVLEATLDRTTSVARDRIVISLPQVSQPERLLGKADEIALVVAPGPLALWAEIDVAGDELQARILLQQTDLKASAQVAPRLGTRLAERIGGALAEVNALQAEVRLSGSLHKPAWQMRSSLGPQVAGPLSQALSAELAARQVELTGVLHQYLTQQQARFDLVLLTEQKKVLDQLSLANRELDDLHRLVAGRVRLPGRGTFEDLPARNPYFRR